MPADKHNNVAGLLPRELLQQAKAEVTARRELTAMWMEATDGTLPEAVFPLKYIDGCLLLGCRNNTWLSRLRHQQGGLLARLQQHPFFQELQKIQLQMQPEDPAIVPLPGERQTRPRRQARMSDDSAAQIRAAAEGVEDPALREALLRLGRGETKA